MTPAKAVSVAILVCIACKTAVGGNAGRKDLQQLIDAARPGSVLVLPKGTYRAPATMNKPLTLRGESATECILEITADEPALLVRSRGPVTIDSLTIRWQLATSERRKQPPCALAVKDSKAVVRGCLFTATGRLIVCS